MTEPFEELGGRPNDWTPIPPGHIRGCGKRPCRHLDRHICPWLNEDHQGHAVQCGCSHEPAVKGGGAK